MELAEKKLRDDRERKKKLASKAITFEGDTHYSPAVKEDLRKKLAQDEQSSSSSSDTSTPSAGGSAVKSGAGAAAQTMASGGSGLDIATSGLMMSGNPYAMGAGLALATLSARRKRLDNQAKMEYEAEQARKKRIVDQLALMSQQATNLGL